MAKKQASKKKAKKAPAKKKAVKKQKADKTPSSIRVTAQTAPAIKADQGSEGMLGKYGTYIIIAVGLLILFNQMQISSILGIASTAGPGAMSFSSDNVDLSAVNVEEITTTAQGIAALFPIGQIQTSQDAINVMIPTGTPDYGEAMGVSYDDPVNSMELMARSYRALNQQLQQNPEQWERYLSLAAQPRGVSCEFCCGVGPIGVTPDGRSKCGCKHHPAVLTLTQWLIQNTDYTDAEILREVYKWKSLYFPKNMVGLAAQIAGGDTSVLQDLPGMVGGC